MRNLQKYIICAVLLLSMNVLADGNGLESPFGMGAGARELALGRAAISLASPTSAAFWNPSMLAYTEKISLEVFHTQLFNAGAKYQFVGLAIPTLDYGSIGVGLFRLGVDDIERRDGNNLLLGQFSESRLAFYLAYGRIIAGYKIGLAASVEHQSLDDYSATSSPGLHLSLSRDFNPGLMRIPEMRISLVGRNIIKPGINLAGENVTYPIALDVGLSFSLIPNQQWNHKAIVSGGLSKSDYVNPKFSLGIEYEMHNLLQLRASLQGDVISLGAGLTFNFMDFDYAFVKRDLGHLHMFSLRTSFGMPLEQRRILRSQRREAEFNQLMNANLNNRNLDMVKDLFRQADEALENNKMDEAELIYDRGLFLAKANDFDTSAIYVDAMETYNFLQEMKIKRACEAYLDSARIEIAKQDFIAARQYAQQALSKLPKTPEAQRIAEFADSTIMASQSRELIINEKLRLADSLLIYGQIENALTVLQTLEQIDAENPVVKAALEKTVFENQRKIAENAFANQDYGSAKIALDSAASILPGHPWSEEMKAKIIYAVRQKQERQKQTPQKEEIVLSRELEKEVAEEYRQGQELFERGQLEEALLKWEKVERYAPDYLSVREYLIRAYKFVGVELYGQNRLQEAVQTWKKALALNPENNEIRAYIDRTENEIIKLQELSYEPE